MKYFSIFFVGILCSISTFLFGQTNDHAQSEKEVRAVIYQMFDAMRAGDSSMLRPLFSSEIVSASAFEREGKSMMRSGNIENFIQAVGTPHDQVWNEKIWNIKIHVDANMATAWMNYAFFRGEEFSHCGVNNFVLFKSDSGWKIVHLMDTRRKANCDLPAIYTYPSGG